MKLIDYIKLPNHPTDISNLDHYKKINFMCQSHGISLSIQDGYENRAMEHFVYYDEKFEKENPHYITLDYYSGEQRSEYDVKSKIIYCETCVQNHESREVVECQDNLKPTKSKGRKSKKYNEKK